MAPAPQPVTALLSLQNHSRMQSCTQKTLNKKLVGQTALVLALSFLIYSLTAEPTFSRDTVPNTLLGFNLLENHTLVFDNFRNTYLGTPASYWFYESPQGHYLSAYPIGTAIVAFPLTLCYWIFLHLKHAHLLLTDASFETSRIVYEQFAARCIASLSAALFFLLCRIRFTPKISLIATAVFAFACSSLTISAQALWQHGAANLCIITAMLCASILSECSISKKAHRVLLATAGFMCALISLIRPVDVLFSLAIIFYCVTRFRKSALWLLTGLLPLALGVAYNIHFFHNLLGGYQGMVSANNFALRFLPAGFLGCTISPGRGLFIYSPVFIFSIIAFAKLCRSRRIFARSEFLLLLIAIASFLSCSVYFFYRGWWGGACYGSRSITEAMPCLSYLIAYYLQLHATNRQTHKTSKIFLLALLLSISIQMVGLMGKGSGLWNAIPNIIDEHPERLWQLQDSPIERSARSFLQRGGVRTISGLFTRTPVATESNSTMCGSVSKPSETADAHIVANAKIETKVMVRNCGQTQWIGYQSGCNSLDQWTYVQVSFLDDNNKVLESCGGSLPVAGSISHGEETFAEGIVQFPPQAGHYRMRYRTQCMYFPDKLNASVPLETTIDVHAP